MAELTKKQKKVLEELKAGTYKTPSEQRRERRDSNLRKQQTEIAPIKNTNNDIAPVKTAPGGRGGKEEEGNWFTRLVKNTVKPSEYFEDGYQRGDILKTAGKTIGHIGSSIVEGGYSVIEGLTDLKKQTQALGTDIATGVTQKILTGVIKNKTGMSDEQADALSGMASNALTSKVLEGTTQGEFSSSKELRESAIENDWDNSFAGDIQDNLREGSVAGSTTEKLGNLVGYTGASVYGGKALGKAGEIALKAGGKYLNIPTLAVTTATSQSLNETYSEEPDVSNVTAWSRGISSGLIEGATEGLFGFLGVGGSSIDEISETVIKGMSEGMAKKLASFGIPATGEAFEELISYAGNQLNDLIIDKADGTVNLHEDWNWEEVGEAMVLAFVSTGVSQGGSSVKNAILEKMSGKQEEIAPTTETQEQEIAPTQEIEQVDTETKIAENEALLEEKTEELEQAKDPRLQEIIRDEIDVIQEEIYTEQERVDSLVEEEAPIGTELTTEEREELDMYEEFVEENGVEALDEASKERYDYLKQHEELDTTPDEEITEESKITSPVAERDMKEIGSRKVKSYMEENPETRPYFQQEAENMLYDLENTIKGEKIVTKVYNPVTGLYENAEWTGTTRQTTDAIAYLRDNNKYTYAQIRQGLEDIIANDGRKLNAVAKRIEVLLDERMRDGYTTSDGIQIPANEEYINYWKEREFNKQSSENFNAITDENAPVEETIEAPSQVDENDRISEENTRVIEDVAPTQKESKNANTDVPVNEEIDTSFMREETKKKLENYQKQRNQLQLDRRQSYRDFNTEIHSKRAEYEALKNKNTKKANNLLQQIANLEMRRDNIQDEYSRRIGNTTARIDNMKTDDFIQKEKKASQDEIRRKLFNDTGIVKESLDFAKDLSKPMLHNTDPIRLQEMVFGRKLGGKINEMLFQKVKDNTSNKIRFQNKERAEIEELGIKARSKESSAVQKYGEKKYVDENGKEHKYGDAELKAEFPNVKDQEKIKHASQVIRQKYDTYIDLVNAEITKYGYEPIPKRQDYMRHFQELNDKFSEWGLPFNMQSAQANDLPTDINGLTADLKPGKNWFASALRRKGKKTTYDAITGIDGYIEGIGNLIYHTGDIQTLRGFENYIREIYGQEHGFENLDNLSDTEKSIRMQQIQDNHLGNYVAWLREYTNNLAGKKAMADRAVEDIFGRRIYSFLTELKAQVGSNMTGLNIGSALTNPISMTQALAKTSKLATVKGYADTIKNIFVKDNFIDQNDFLTSRFGSDILSPTAWQKMRNAGQVFMAGTDWFASNAITRSKFYELKAQGLSDTEAHKEAGKFASRILGDRSQGATPTLYNSKMLGLVTQFQLEVNNQLYSMFGDTIADAKETSTKEGVFKASMRATFVLGQLAVFQHTYNNLYESIAGRRPAFDILSMIGTVLGIGSGDDEEEKPLDDRIFEAMDMLVDALPYVNILTGGGRIPISEALPFQELLSGEDEYGNEKSRLKTLGEALPYYFLPTGYSQIKKTVGGLGMYDEDLPIAGSYTDSGNMRFTAEDDPMSRLQAGIFGKWAGETAQDYIKSDFQSVDKDNIDELVELDFDSTKYIEYRKGLSEIRKLELEDEESRLSYVYDYISNFDATEEQKGIMFKHYSSDKEQEAFKELDMSPEDIVSYYGAKTKIGEQTAEYLADKELLTSDTESEEYKEAVKTLSKEKKAVIIDAVRTTNLTDEQKKYLYTKYYSSEKALDKILDKGVSMNTYLKFEKDTLWFEADEETDGATPYYGKGNIDLNNRPVVYNKDGSISTVRSISIGEDGKEILIPTVVNGRIVSDEEAIEHYHNTGEYLGKFNTTQEANAYAENLHKEQEEYYKNKKKGKVISGSKGNKYEEYLLNSSMSDRDKQTLYEYGVLSSFDDEDNYKKYKAFKSAGIDINSYLSYASQTFTADKDRYGETISGSRRTKIIKYVNKLNLSIPQKAMIIRSEYSSYRDYNKQIIKYVNSLDLTIAEKTKILEELDFTVKGSTISWK